MIKIIHCADLHLSLGDSKEYSLSVLKEIVLISKKHDANFLIFAGDTFDSFPDAEAVREEFKDIIAPLKNKCEILLLPGNHENINRKCKKMANYDFGIPSVNMLETDGKPYIFLKKDGIEFIAIPHQDNYHDYIKWEVPDKREKVRIAIAHGVVAEMNIYTGPDSDQEGDAGIIGKDLFRRFYVDYAAMGHIHNERIDYDNNLTVCYPGSARVWRSGERGPRKIYIVEVEDNEITPQSMELESAGQYHKHEILLNLGGEVKPMDEITTSCSKNDYLEVCLSGFVENEQLVLKRIEELKDTLSGVIRKLSFSNKVNVADGITSEPIAKRFLELWEKDAPKNDLRREKIWKKARELGLKKIMEKVEGRQ